MKITWIGHSCFKIEEGGFAVITDPYEDGYVPGLGPVRESAQQVLVSHEHGDHNARARVRIVPGGSSPFAVTKIETFHDDKRGALRGPNTIHVLQAGDIRIAHFGDLGCELEESQLEQLMDLDAAMIPVGGHYTIDAAQAAALVKKIRPRHVIPMHFRDDKAGFGFPVIGTVEEFTAGMETVRFAGASVLDLQQAPAEQVIVLVPANLN